MRGGSIRWRARHVAAGSDLLVMAEAIMTEVMVTGAAAAAAALFRMRRQLGCHCGSSGFPAVCSQRGWVFGCVCLAVDLPFLCRQCQGSGCCLPLGRFRRYLVRLNRVLYLCQTSFPFCFNFLLKMLSHLWNKLCGLQYCGDRCTCRQEAISSHTCKASLS